jgi:non-ribosomal peptide synthetase-like protein
VVENTVDVLTAGPAESSTNQGTYAGPTTGTERVLAEVLADVVSVEQVSVDSHFFDDLGANSLVMAHFCARVRKRADLPSVSMKDIYRHPTIKSLAQELEDTASTPSESPAPAPAEVSTPASTPQYVLCGALQFLIFLGYSILVALVVTAGYEWISAGSGLIDYYLRSVLFGCATFLALCIFPVLMKWVLIGRWKPRQIRVWSLAYVRFWIVKTLVQRNLLVLLFVGSPLYPLYLRALGAKIGRGVAIFSRTVPACTDLLTIGDGTVIRKDSHVTCYRAAAGLIQTGTVTLGKEVFVGELTVIDIGTRMGDGAQLGHTSSLHTGQAVPDGERWHGSPAQRTEVDYRTVDATDCGTLRRAGYAVVQVLNLLLIFLPLAVGGADIVLREIPRLVALESGPAALGTWTYYVAALFVSFVLFFGLMLVGLVVLATFPRLLNLAIKPDKLYRLYGIHYSVHRVIVGMTNNRAFKTLFGDSSAIVHYLRYLGYRLPDVEQTGSNFGTHLKHENPYLSSVGSGTMVADGLSIINADYSSTSFRVSGASIGPHNFLGNHIAYPSTAKTGDNCLLATKAMIPIEGEVREGVGLLGSPSFDIPRSVQRDTRFDHLREGDELHRRLKAKNRHNAVTAGMYLFASWIYLFIVMLLAWTAARLYGPAGTWAIAVATVVSFVLTACYFVLFERAVQVFLPLRPLYCSIYDRRFWRHERFWKSAAVTAYLHAFNGTPFKNVVWRALGVRIGRRVFDDGCSIPEKTLVTIGDDTTLNLGSTIQCHSQEDGAFKSDRITIGAGCTVGVGAWVHYGVTMGDGAVLAPDAFLMKGEDVPPHTRWAGNPARDLRDDRVANAQVGRGGKDIGSEALSPADSAVATVAGGTRWDA